MISDRDPRFTSHFAKALCNQLGIKQNISTAFHPQTDGLSERKNQWIEQFLRFLTMHQQDDWAQWLPITTAVHNNAVNALTKLAPTEALLGYLPRLDYRSLSASLNPQVEMRKETAIQKREQAKTALLSFSRDCAARDFLLLSFARIFNELYLAQIWMKCLDISYVDCCTYILGACKFIEPENTSL